jgi:hypothetical protein
MRRNALPRTNTRWHTLAHAEVRSALTPSYYLYRELTMDKASRVLAKALLGGVF